jgi:predicted phosphodiesterase
MKIWFIFLVGVLLNSFVSRANGEEITDFSVQHGPYLTNMTTDAVTIIWFTNKIAAGAVEILDEDGSWREVSTQKHGLKDAYSLMHKIEIKGLKSGSTYHYRTVSREIKNSNPYGVLFGERHVSATSRFEVFSIKRSEFSVYIINDNHEDKMKIRTLLSLFPLRAGDFVVFNGDMVNYISDEKQIFENVIDPATEFFAKEFPLVYVRGNHELRGKMARDLYNYFPTTEGTPYFRFRQGGVEFYVFDSGEDKQDGHFEYSGLVNFDAYRMEQTAWLKNRLQEEKPLFRVALMHIPLYGGSDWYGERQNRKSWGGLLNQHGIDLMVSGHTHKFSWVPYRQGLHDYPIMISGTKNFIRMDVTPKQLLLRVISLDGKVIEEQVIRIDP